jgi:hypothetical protein
MELVLLADGTQDEEQTPGVRFTNQVPCSFPALFLCHLYVAGASTPCHCYFKPHSPSIAKRFFFGGGGGGGGTEV